MIFNYCIYGDILPLYSGEIKITIYDNTITEVYTKTLTVENEYQFNLGDRDLFGINYNLRNGSTAVISLQGKYFPIILGENYLHRFDINLNTLMSPTNSIASDSDNLLKTVRIITDKLILREIDNNLYSYFEVSKDTNIVYSGNIELNWVPRESGNYNILHRVYNSSNLEVSESVINIDILENYVEVNSINYIYYCKRDKIIQIELPEYVLDTVLLTNGFYIENKKLYGKLVDFNIIELLYSRGKIIIKPQIGDILDY